MPTLDPRTAYRLGLYVVVGLLLAVGIRSCPETHADPARDLLSQDLAKRLHANTLALDSARVALRSAESRTQQTLVRYIRQRDSLVITDTVQVKVFVARADSVVRSCTELVVSCATLRVRADSSIADLTLDRDRWKLAAESEKPSGLSLFVRRTLPVVAFVGGVYVGSRVVR